MRVPKFRAWDKENKEMLFVRQIDFMFEKVVLECYEQFFIDEVELMQSTGLKDINSEEVYEGDIVKIPDDYDAFGHNAGEILKVAFDSGCFRLKRPNSKGRGFYFEDDNTVEIIGNIYENPELAEEEE
ncbi:hypothetical protein E0E04_04820 [Streptococcus vicugnae]|uniref:YopX protein domain-containing protein n=1 Tax=Streptococcus vicugnae TaxID=2740579 RepID=A0A4R5G5M9_9STRE|nr:YopX family protein [Streptococcus vicugnae]TDE72974.1 hypothetical protein E0E04_04820 [Streptococcus vicugnae]